MRRGWRLAIVLGLALVSVAARPPRVSVVEASIADTVRALRARRVTSRELVQQSLTRIALYEDRLNAIITDRKSTRLNSSH